MSTLSAKEMEELARWLRELARADLSFDPDATSDWQSEAQRRALALEKRAREMIEVSE